MRTPVTVVTGAPGSGKSTLVNRLLAERGSAGVAVVESEFGDVEVEHDLVIAADPAADDLARTLSRLARRREPLVRVIVEVADPAGAVTALADDEVAEVFALEAVVDGDGAPAPVRAPAAPPPQPVPDEPADPVTPEALVFLAEARLGDWVGALAWHPLGDLLSAACSDGLVHEVQASSGASAPVGRHDGGAAAVAYAPDGALASGGADGRVAVGTVPPQLAGAGWVEQLCFSPDGALLATAVGRRVQLWTAAGSLAAEAEPLGAPVDCLAWAPDGRRLACGGAGGAVLLAADGSGTDARVAADGRVRALAFTADGRRLACGMQEREVQLWDLATGRARALGGFLRPVRDVAWSADGRWMVASGGVQVVAWRFLDGPGDIDQDEIVPLQAHRGPVCRAAFQPRGPFLATAGRDGAAVLWYPPQRRPMAAATLGEPIGAAAWSADGRRLAVGTASGRVAVFGLAGVV